jgi:oxygen-independent coproporphyrinogen-3 oxidase
MAGLYLHVPYCRKACTYCDFHFSTQLGTQDRMVEAMQQEIKHRINDIAPMNTWYWGGGTPSILGIGSMEKLIATCHEVAPLAQGGEFTLEANPEDLTASNLTEWRNLGINRLSVGVQSFIDRRLVWMNRSHSGDEATIGIKRAQDLGFENISLDLIYGIPTTSLGEWQENVGRAMDLGIPHLSTYALTVEERTPLHYAIQKGQAQLPEDARAREDFLWLRGHLREENWDPYEISNASVPGKRSQHNSAYWEGIAYLGIGPGAHSFDGFLERRWNVSNNARYMQDWLSLGPNQLHDGNSVRSTRTSYEIEALSLRDRLNEQIMTNLRRSEGLERTKMGEHASTLDQAWSPFREQGWLIQNPERWYLTDEGLLWMDRIASEGFIQAENLP